MKNLKVRAKILIPVIVATILIAAAVLSVSIVQFSNNVDAEIHASLSTSSQAIAKNIQGYQSEAHVAALYIATDQEIAQAIAEGDREALLSRSKTLQTGTGVEFCTITDQSGSVILRTHEPENYGDSVASQANVQAAMSGQSLSAVEEGTAVRMSVRAGAPIFDSNGNVIGVVSVGYRLDTDTFVDASKSIYGAEVTIFQGDERIATTVIQADGKRAIGTKAVEEVSQVVLAGGSYAGQAKVLDSDALVQYTPIKNAEDEVIGMIFVGRYLTEKTATVWSFVWMSGLVALAILAATILVMFFIINNIIKPLKIMSEFMQQAGDTGNIAIGQKAAESIQKLSQNKDEIGVLSKSCAAFVEHINSVSESMEAVANNDLATKVTPLSDKDTLGISLQKMIHNVHEAVREVKTSAAQVSVGANQIASGAQSLAAGATEQAASVEELSSSISEINSMAKENKANADEALADVQQAGQLMNECAAEVKKMLGDMQEIDAQSEAIKRIVKVIDEIAFQTNILALNAAVEAARAGQHGKGFAVVAEEVRSLASKSAEAAKEIADLIASSSKSVKAGSETAQKVDESLQGVARIARLNAEKIADVQAISAQQSSAMEQVNIGIDQIAQIVQQNSATAEESAAASEELSGQADMLNQQVSQFKLTKD